jgi:hypothetical protein
MLTWTGLLDATPILMLIALGVALRAAGIINREGGLMLSRLAFHVTIPATIFYSIARARFEGSMIWLPVLGFVVPTVLSGVAWLTTRHLADQPRQRGVMVCAMVVLGIFGYAFLELFFGADGLARMGLYDVGNAVYAGTLSLWIAQRFNPDNAGRRGLSGWRKLLTSPVMWAALLGLAFGLLRIPVGGPVGDLLQRLVNANTPVAMIAVGVFLRVEPGYGRLIAHYLGIRMLLGGALAFGLALLLRMSGLDLVVAVSAATLPSGNTALIYAGSENLDAEFAAAAISASVIIGAVVINVLPHLLAAVYM